MPIWDYSIKDVDMDLDRTVKCAGREISVSPKAVTELCRTIKGMLIKDAKHLLENVIEKKTSIPYKHYKKKVPHRKSNDKWFAGRYPVKAAKILMKLLEELESNAEYKGFNLDNIKIIHAASQRGRKIRKAIPRAHGRASPYYDALTHIELIGYEVF